MPNQTIYKGLIMKTFTLTFTQTKTLIENLGRDTVETFINDINDQPEFLKNMGKIDSVSELLAIYQGGCASGAYMPAVTYWSALECMKECSDSVEAQIEHMEEVTWKVSEETFAGFCTKLCSMAVEDYVQQFSEVIEVLETTDY